MIKYIASFSGSQMILANDYDLMLLVRRESKAGRAIKVRTLDTITQTVEDMDISKWTKTAGR